MTCAHSASQNPRHAGWCVRCGLPLPKRDTAFEAEMLQTACELCQRVHGRNAVAYAREVQSRLAKGESEYGSSYLSDERDNIAEAAFEPPDVASYLLLELQRLRPTLRDEDFQELRMLALDAMAGAAAVHDTLLRLKRTRDEFV